MSSSGLSSPLSSPPQSEDEKLAPIFRPKKKMAVNPSKKRQDTPESVVSTPKRKRSPSPPHEEVLADNPDIAFIVMFRSRFTDAFSLKMSHFGPQDLENGVVDSVPSPLVESLLCALLGLVLNRKKPVERGHFGRALEDSISTHKTQWPIAWQGRNPLNGNQSFATMSPQQRLTLLRTLILWSLNSSEVITNIIKESYKQSRHDDDLNQPLSVHPWGRDGDKRRYWLIEGKDDTAFRLYRESNPALKTITWRSVAGTIEDLQGMGTKLGEDGTQAARRLAERINIAIPRFEATEEKRKKREYRAAHKARFSRPEPGFSLYEGRTRGKRTKYTFSDDEDELSLSDVMPRRSTRAAASTVQPEGPMVTASGRTVRSRIGGMYGEILHSGQTTGVDTPITNGGSEEPGSGSGLRASRTGWAPHQPMNGYNSVDEMEEDEEEAQSSGNEWDGGDEEEEDDELELDDDLDEDELAPRSLVVRLRIPSRAVTPGIPVAQIDHRDGGGGGGDAIIPANNLQPLEPRLANISIPLTNGTTKHDEVSPTPTTQQLPTPTTNSISNNITTTIKPSHPSDSVPPSAAWPPPPQDASPSKPS